MCTKRVCCRKSGHMSFDLVLIILAVVLNLCPFSCSLSEHVLDQVAVCGKMGSHGASCTGRVVVEDRFGDRSVRSDRLIHQFSFRNIAEGDYGRLNDGHKSLDYHVAGAVCDAGMELHIFFGVVFPASIQGFDIVAALHDFLGLSVGSELGCFRGNFRFEHQAYVEKLKCEFVFVFSARKVERVRHRRRSRHNVRPGAVPDFDHALAGEALHDFPQGGTACVESFGQGKLVRQLVADAALMDEIIDDLVLNLRAEKGTVHFGVFARHGGLLLGI